MLPLWVRVQLGAMAIKCYSTFPGVPELEPHYQIGQCHIWTLLGWRGSYVSAEMQSIYFTAAPCHFVEGQFKLQPCYDVHFRTYTLIPLFHGLNILPTLLIHCPFGWDCRIHWPHLCRGVKTPMSVLDITLNNLVVRFQWCWGFGKCGIPLHCHCSHLIEPYLWVK